MDYINFVDQKPKKLLDQVREKIRLKNDASLGISFPVLIHGIFQTANIIQTNRTGLCELDQYVIIIHDKNHPISNLQS